MFVLRVITDPLFYLLAIPAVTLLGLGKGGFAGVGMISTPLLALVVPPLQGAAILLPILLSQDAISVWAYRHQWSGSNLRVLVPGSVLGIGAAWLLASHVSNATIELSVGAIGLCFVLHTWLGALLRPSFGQTPPKAKRPHWGMGILWGSLAGFMSTLIQVGTPPYQAHILPQRLDKLTLVGTTVIFFALMNLMKVVPYFAPRPVLAANFGDLAGAAAASRRHEFSRYLAGAQDFDRAILSNCLPVDAFDFGDLDLAGLARAR